MSMTSDYQRRSPVRETGNIKNYLGNGAAVKNDGSDPINGLQTQLLFNLAVPTSALNRATRVGPPGPIVIKKLSGQLEPQDTNVSCSSSLRFSVLSEEHLETAVRLAKKDLRRKRQESINNLSHKTTARSPDKNKTDNQQNGFSCEGRQRTPSPQRQLRSSTQLPVYTSQNLFPPSTDEQRQSPPNRDPEPKAVSSEPQLSREICKLQKELETYVQRIEQLVNKERIVESVEPDEKRRLEIRQQEQTARSARIIYVLQQQVKEIQEDLDKLRSQSVRTTSKCRAVNRLAAAHRGAVRAMQAFIQQLSDPAESRVPVQCKELGQLIRQLSLCSAKVEVGQGSAVPETTLDILQKLEMLDLALSKQNSLQEQRMRSVSPVRQRTFRVSGCSKTCNRFAQAQTAKATRRPKKGSAPKTNRREAGLTMKSDQFLDQERNEVLKTGIQNLVRMRVMREGKRQSRPEIDIPKSSSSSAHPDKCKPNIRVCDAGFQQPTLSSKLRESHLPQREASVPWVPTSPHSLVKQRTVSNTPEPRCLFPPVKNSSQPTGVQAKSQTQENTSMENIRDSPNQASRQACLAPIAENRERELNSLSEEEMEDIHTRRANAGSPTQWTERAVQTTRETPLKDCVQNAVNTDVEATAGAVQMVDGEHDTLLRDPMMDNMLLSTEEIEKDEVEVRRRFAMISYSDPLLWDMKTGIQRKLGSSRPSSPQPIRLTKPAKRHSTTGDIVIQTPVETSVVSESSMLDEEAPSTVPCCITTEQAHKKGAIRLNVPSSIQTTIQKYRKEHDSYLSLVSHAAVGSFNPCAVAESVAEELMMEALADVAGEFQNVCEEYAEAIFTSEFLKPLPSLSPSVS